MKKILILIFIGVSILAFYIFSSKEQVSIEVDRSSDPSSAIKFEKYKNRKKEHTTKDEKRVSKDLNPSKAQLSEHIDTVEEKWKEGIDDLFSEYGDTAEQNKIEYRKLKNGYEVERERRYEEFHLMMEQKHGPNYSYSPSADEEMYNEKLIKVYELELSKKIGKDLMIKYMSYKDNFNNELESSSKKDDAQFLEIEF